MLLSLLPLIFLLVLGATCWFAFWRGGSAERIVAAACVAAALLSLLAAIELGHRWRSPEYGVLLVDVGLLVVLVWVALTSDRYWPLWAAAFQLVAVITHLAIMANPKIVPRAYSLAQPFWAYPVLAALLLGTWQHSRRKSANAATRLPESFGT